MVKIAHEGHMGLVKTKQLVRERVWFPCIDKMVEEAIDSCKACCLASSGSKPVPLMMTDPPERVWQRLAMDFHGPLSNGHELLCVIDELSKFPVVLEVNSTAAQYVLPKLDSLFSLMGIPEVVKTDNGPPFQGKDFKDFCDEFGIKHRRITPAWPQANGQVEVFNRNIKRIIQKSFISNSDWRTELNGYLRSYRNTPHSSTKVAPADLVFVGSNSSKLPGLVKHRSSNVDLVSIARENDLKSKQRMKDYADAKRGAKSHDLKVNDEVFVDQNYGKKIVNKYSPRWSSQIWKVKLMNGSLVTVESNGKQLTRNSVFFKKVSDGLSKQIGNDSDLFDERLWYSGRESGKSKAMGRMESNETVSDVGLTGEDNDASVPRRSTRSVRQVDRFVAGPASGLRSKASKT